MNDADRKVLGADIDDLDRPVDAGQRVDGLHVFVGDVSRGGRLRLRQHRDGPQG
jgi:hypothetical protein